MDKGNPRFFTVPRIFRKGVKIDKNKLTPQGFEKFRYEIFLNGWILENERN